ncbi:MAG: hypothetical protein ACE5JP_02595 [Candidatus Bipolaricaulia bacterium]
MTRCDTLSNGALIAHFGETLEADYERHFTELEHEVRDGASASYGSDFRVEVLNGESQQIGIPKPDHVIDRIEEILKLEIVIDV